MGAWLQQEQISLAFTTYQTNRLILLGSNAEGRLAMNERLFDKPMGLFAQGDNLYMSTRYQIWRFENHLQPGETYQGGDRLYVPSLSYTTGNLNVHDIVLDQTGNLLFVNTDFSCLATLQSPYSFVPIWQPPFISKIAAEDRCHLNGLAMVEGKETYMTACSATDNPAGWRDYRKQGGIILHLPSNEIIVTNLSMPHSPRWYQEKLWLLNSGTGELGYIDNGQFVPITFCPGFVRGLAFWQNYAFVGLSKLRSASFTGLELENRLGKEGKVPQCGLMIIDIRNGQVIHSLILEGAVEELFDVVVLPGVLRPRALGFADEDIERLITFPGSKGLITTKPTVKRPSLGPTAPIAGLPTKARLKQEALEAREIEALEANIEKKTIAHADVKFQRVYHLNPESLAPYDAMTFPSLQRRWTTQPQRGELIGVSASVTGDMVGFTIAELLPDFRAEVISLFVDPHYRQQGIGTKMMAFLERELLTQKCHQVELVYSPILLTEKALEVIFSKLGWQSPTPIGNNLQRAYKRLISEVTPKTESLSLVNTNPQKEAAQSLSDAASRTQFEAGKERVKDNDLEGAISCFQEAIRLQPDYIPAYNQLGNALQNLGKSDEAIAAYQQLLQINPNVAPAHCNLGSIWQIQGKFEEAIASYQQAIKLKPDFVMAYRNLGSLFANQKQFRKAETYLSQALQLQPKAAGTYHDLGNTLRQMGRLEDALICFRNAIKLDPQFSEAHQNLGCLLMSKGQMKTAQKCFEKVLTLQPDSLTVHTNLGYVLEAQGKFNEALNAYSRALELNPEATDVLYQREHLRLTLCDWEDFDRRVQTLTERIQNHVNTPGSPRLAPLSLSSFPVSIALHTALNRHWGKTITQAMAELKTHCAFTPRLITKEKIRLGYLSGDFRSHAVGSMIAQIFQYHDRSHFEVYGYSLADTADEITTIIQNGCDAFVNIAALSVEEGARRIYHDQIDILIDLTGYTTFCRPEILALQPAPIQIQYLGYPDTMGAEFIQYILTDHWIVPPELASHYTEQVIELPHAFVTAPQEISSNVPTRQELRLPEQGFVYCCFNRTDKFDPHLFAAWMHILQRVPESVLWLSEVTPKISETLRQKAQAQGIDPQRLVFSPSRSLAEFVAICQRADLFLDTFTYNAGATAICGLQAGLPILTCPGETFASRMAASICASVNLESLICDSPQAYEQQAIYLGTHPEALEAIRENLLRQKEQLPLFQPQQWIANLESVLQKLWQQFTTASATSLFC